MGGSVLGREERFYCLRMGEVLVGMDGGGVEDMG